MATVYSKPTVRQAWAETASGSDIQDPGNTFAAAGWPIGAKPPRQYFNWVLNYTFAGVRYLCQHGIATWDANEVYSAGSLVQDAGGFNYQSIVNNNTNKLPSSNFNSSGWLNPAVQTPNAANGTWQVPNLAWVQGNFLAIGSSFASIAGTVFNSQVPFSAVQQWQGSLSIAFSQLSGTIFNSQVPLSAVQQWQGSLLIGWGQITGTKNADQLQGLTATTSPAGNTIVVRDASGYAYVNYLNQASANDENPTISQFMVTNGADNFLRKAGLNTVLRAICGGQGIAGSGIFFRIGGFVVQAGYATGPTSSVGVVWPEPFSGVVGAVCSTNRSTQGSAGFNHVAAVSNFGGTFVFDQLDNSSIHGGWWLAWGTAVAGE